MGIDGCCSAKWCIGTKIEAKNKSSVTFSILLFQGEKLTSRLTKPELAEGNLQQTSPVVCPCSLTHHCSSTIRRGLWKSTRTILFRSWLFFLQTWQALKARKLLEGAKKSPPKNWLYLLPPKKPAQKTTWEESVVPYAHFCTPSSAADIKNVLFLICTWGKLFQLLMQVGKTAPSDICCPNQTEYSAQCMLNTVCDALAGSRKRTGSLPKYCINISPFQVNTLWVWEMWLISLFALWFRHSQTSNPWKPDFTGVCTSVCGTDSQAGQVQLCGTSTAHEVQIVGGSRFLFKQRGYRDL